MKDDVFSNRLFVKIAFISVSSGARAHAHRTPCRRWANRVGCKWGWTDLTGFCLFSSVGVRLVPKRQKNTDARTNYAVKSATARALISSKTKGPGEKGAPRNHTKNFVSETGRFLVQIAYDSYGRDRAPFWPWGNIRRPLLLPAPLFYCSGLHKSKKPVPCMKWPDSDAYVSWHHRIPGGSL